MNRQTLGRVSHIIDEGKVRMKDVDKQSAILFELEQLSMIVLEKLDKMQATLDSALASEETTLSDTEHEHPEPGTNGSIPANGEIPPTDGTETNSLPATDVLPQ